MVNIIDRVNDPIIRAIFHSINIKAIKAIIDIEVSVLRGLKWGDEVRLPSKAVRQPNSIIQFFENIANNILKIIIRIGSPIHIWCITISDLVA